MAQKEHQRDLKGGTPLMVERRYRSSAPYVEHNFISAWQVGTRVKGQAVSYEHRPFNIWF